MAKKKPKGRRADALKLFINARSFQKTAIVLDAQPDKVWYFWPMVVNEAFALELFIKCLHCVRRRNVRGHDLHKLFGMLSIRDRRKIAKYLDEIVRKHPLYETAVSHGVQFDIESILMRSKDTFANMRYWHEDLLPGADASGKSTNAGAGNLSDAIDRLILEIRPEWRQAYIRLPEKLLLSR